MLNEFFVFISVASVDPKITALKKLNRQSKGQQYYERDRDIKKEELKTVFKGLHDSYTKVKL